jgi:hypothetical protein
MVFYEADPCSVQNGHIPFLKFLRNLCKKWSLFFKNDEKQEENIKYAHSKAG